MNIIFLAKHYIIFHIVFVLLWFSIFVYSGIIGLYSIGIVILAILTSSLFIFALFKSKYYMNFVIAVLLLAFAAFNFFTPWTHYGLGRDENGDLISHFHATWELDHVH